MELFLAIDQHEYTINQGTIATINKSRTPENIINTSTSSKLTFIVDDVHAKSAGGCLEHLRQSPEQGNVATIEATIVDIVLIMVVALETISGRRQRLRVEMLAIHHGPRLLDLAR